MKTLGSEQIVHDPAGRTFIVRGEDDEYSVHHCTLVEVGRYRRKYQAVDAIGNTAGPVGLGRTAEQIADRRRNVIGGLAARLTNVQRTVLHSHTHKPGDCQPAIFDAVETELRSAGIELTSDEARQIRWLCNWEPATIATVVGLMLASSWGGTAS